MCHAERYATNAASRLATITRRVKDLSEENDDESCQMERCGAEQAPNEIW